MRPSRRRLPSRGNFSFTVASLPAKRAKSSMRLSGRSSPGDEPPDARSRTLRPRTHASGDGLTAAQSSTVMPPGFVDEHAHQPASRHLEIHELVAQRPEGTFQPAFVARFRFTKQKMGAAAHLFFEPANIAGIAPCRNPGAAFRRQAAEAGMSRPAPSTAPSVRSEPHPKSFQFSHLRRTPPHSSTPDMQHARAPRNDVSQSSRLFARIRRQPGKGGAARGSTGGSPDRVRRRSGVRHPVPKNGKGQSS